MLEQHFIGQILSLFNPDQEVLPNDPCEIAKGVSPIILPIGQGIDEVIESSISRSRHQPENGLQICLCQCTVFRKDRFIRPERRWGRFDLNGNRLIAELVPADNINSNFLHPDIGFNFPAHVGKHTGNGLYEIFMQFACSFP
ncbi:hypothetical protein [Thalassospira xiamenensis]|uniref:hypothetical protein n=1 Tax=Thalassospira xiamenensis TaxID=220697 RepID=UPI0011BEC606|nr:hypothetical protein [Thalassospira xiamenensis]